LREKQGENAQKLLWKNRLQRFYGFVAASKYLDFPKSELVEGGLLGVRG
jgi:hypothetical protein